MEKRMKVMSVEEDSPGTKRFVLAKPSNYPVIPGRAVNVTIPKKGLEKTKIPLPFASLNSDLYLELMIKDTLRTDLVSNALREIKAGEELVLSEVVGSWDYKGKGAFIVSGKGVVLAWSVLKQLKNVDMLDGHSLIYLAQSKDDIMLERQLKHLLGNNFFVVGAKEKEYKHKRFDALFVKDYLRKLDQKFYLFGPQNAISSCQSVLSSLNIQPITQVID